MDNEKIKCGKCNGTGTIRHLLVFSRKCNICHGTGEIPLMAFGQRTTARDIPRQNSYTKSDAPSDKEVITGRRAITPDIQPKAAVKSPPPNGETDLQKLMDADLEQAQQAEEQRKQHQAQLQQRNLAQQQEQLMRNHQQIRRQNELTNQINQMNARNRNNRIK